MRSGGISRRKLKPPVVPGWVWAGLITGAVLIVLFVANTIAFGLAAASGGASLVCYPFQLLAYLFNGWLAGQMESGRQRILKKLNPRHQPPSYLVVGALGGLVATAVAAIAYLVTTAAIVALVPPAVAVFGPSVAILIVIDAVAAVGLGLIGGLVYNRLFS